MLSQILDDGQLLLPGDVTYSMKEYVFFYYKNTATNWRFAKAMRVRTRFKTKFRGLLHNYPDSNPLTLNDFEIQSLREQWHTEIKHSPQSSQELSELDLKT